MWFDEALNVERVAVATYNGDGKLCEYNYGPEPFDQPGAVLDAALRTLDAQLTLFNTDG